MSYQVLARKYRPRTFDELVGQEHVSRALIHALDQDRLHHAYLFTGTRGVGKTTIARILSRCLNCEEGVSSQPCGVCDSCREISEGRFVDLIEVDAASRTKVEDTRELLENVQYAPTRGRYKVYLIDEVHMLSAHSFNALLKTLEEPPPHVVFLLATTDPQKLPVTILSRCLQFSLKALSGDKIATHIRALLEREMISYEDDALQAIGKAARGSMRDALSLTDQAIAFSSEKLSATAVASMLGNIDRAHVAQLLQAIAMAEPAGVLDALDRVAEHSPDEVALLDELISGFHRLAVAQVVPEREQDDALAALAKQFQAEQVQLCYDIALRGRRDLPDAPDPRAGLEMVLLRMVLFRPDGVLVRAGEPGAKKSPEPMPVPGASVNTPGAGQRPEPPAQRRAAEAPVASRAASPAAEQPALRSVPEPTHGESPSVESSQPPQASPAPRSDPEQRPEALAEAVSDDPASWWAALTERLPLEGAIRNLARNCLLLARDGDRWRMALRSGHQVLAGAERVRALEAGLAEYFGRPVKLEIAVDDGIADTPDDLADQRRRQRLEEARQSLRQDRIVHQLVEQFAGRLDEESIQAAPE